MLKNYIWRQHGIENSDQSSVIITFSVVLSEKKARQYFGTVSLDQIIGKEVIYDDSLRVRVTGIVRDWNENTDQESHVVDIQIDIINCVRFVPLSGRKSGKKRGFLYALVFTSTLLADPQYF